MEEVEASESPRASQRWLANKTVCTKRTDATNRLSSHSWNLESSPWMQNPSMVMGVIGEEGRMGIYCQKLQKRTWRSYPEGQRTQQQYSRVEDILARWSLLLGIIRNNYNLFPTGFSEERIFPPHNSRKFMVYQATGIWNVTLTFGACDICKTEWRFLKGRNRIHVLHEQSRFMAGEDGSDYDGSRITFMTSFSQWVRRGHGSEAYFRRQRLSS